MLVLTRKQQEKIRIGDQITITVLRTKGKAVRLGIEAPAEVPVIRGELTFQVADVVEGEEQGDEPEVAPAMSVEVIRTSGPAGRNGTDWSTNSAPSSSTNRMPGVAPQVSFQRVSRTEVAESLPGVANGESPLRAMMKRRSLSA
jgi:carbon storage regulator CsrA